MVTFLEEQSTFCFLEEQGMIHHTAIECFLVPFPEILFIRELANRFLRWIQ